MSKPFVTLTDASPAGDVTLGSKVRAARNSTQDAIIGSILDILHAWALERYGFPDLDGVCTDTLRGMIDTDQQLLGRLFIGSLREEFPDNIIEFQVCGQKFSTAASLDDCLDRSPDETDEQLDEVAPLSADAQLLLLQAGDNDTLKALILAYGRVREEKSPRE